MVATDPHWPPPPKPPPAPPPKRLNPAAEQFVVGYGNHYRYQNPATVPFPPPPWPRKGDWPPPAPPMPPAPAPPAAPPAVTAITVSDQLNSLLISVLQPHTLVVVAAVIGVAVNYLTTQTHGTLSAEIIIALGLVEAILQGVITATGHSVAALKVKLRTTGRAD